ncbi:MAG TPA: AI-2E family transporter [Propionibacteriaceae bacterium]|nr:AI-2E family transporter [Propionibacteriaceae bacterium]
MGSSGRNGRQSPHQTRRTLPVLAPSNDHAVGPPETEPEPPQPEPAVVANTAELGAAAVPRGLHIAAAWSWRVILVIALLGGLVWLVRYLSEVVIPIAVAILLTALMLPLANRLKKWGTPRGAATAVTVLGSIAIIVGVLIVIVGQIARQGSELSANVVNGFYQLSDWLQNGPLTNWLRNGPLHLDAAWLDSSTWVTRITEFLRASGSTIATYAAEFGAQVGHFLAGLALAIFALFYFIYDGRGIWTFLLKFFPRNGRDLVDQAAVKGWRSLSSYVRATILVALVDSIGVLIVALILGVPVAPALAALVFIGAFIPIVGALVSGFVAVLVALVALGWVQALIMLGGVILVMQLEGHVLQPFLLGRAVKLHPLAVLISIAIGIVVGGIVGALLAVPLLAFTKSFILSLAGGAEPPLGKAYPPALPLYRRQGSRTSEEDATGSLPSEVSS